MIDELSPDPLLQKTDSFYVIALSIWFRQRLWAKFPLDHKSQLFLYYLKN